MWSAYLFCKLSSINNIAKSTIPCFSSLRKSESLSSPFFPGVYNNRCSINYCSLVEAIDSGSGLKSRNRKHKKSDSFTVAYLVNSCGLSAERAILLSKKVNFESPEKPNAVLGFLGDQGFSKNHIAKIVKSAPRILLCNPEKTLLPKIQFFRSLWESRTDLANNMSSNHHLLVYSLDSYILPIFNCFKSIFLTDDRIAATSVWRAAFFCKDPIKNLVSNVAVLRELGVPESRIRMSLAHWSLAVMQDHDQFAEAVAEVKEMGFDPSKSTFMLALRSRSGKGNRSRWIRCCEIYRSWGWSEDDIRKACRNHPGCMVISERKLTRMMDILINKMGWNSQSIVRCPIVICFSLEKRIIPRASVIHFLCSKGLIKKELSSNIFRVSEKKFLGKFVTPYVEQAPQICDVYQGKMGIFHL